MRAHIVQFVRLFCLFTAVSLHGFLTAQTAPGTNLNLFNGTSLLGWNATGTWAPTNGMLATTGSGTRTILTAVPFGDLSLHFEYNVSGSPNARLRLWSTKAGSGGFQIDLDNNNAAWGVGGIEQSSRSKMATMSEGWHRVDVEASSGRISVQVDHLPVALAIDVGSRAGYLGFEATGVGSLQVRSVRLTPMNLTPDFNGSDLSGWKSIAYTPAAQSGVGHAMAKTLSFGLAGKDKPHSANWTVRGGALHGEGGPGGLETSALYDDLILHLTATVNGGVAKKDNFTGISLRNTAGQLRGGYPVGIGVYSGQVENLVAKTSATNGSAVDETVVLAGRTVAIWIGPNLATVYTDSRPESGTVAQGAKTSAGALTLTLPNEKASLDVQRLAIAMLPKTYGLAARSAPPAPPAPPVATQAVAPPPLQVSPAETVMLQQQQETAKKDAAAQADKQRTASLMSQALSTTSPEQQMSLYGQVVQIDPSNAAAVQGFKEAQTKVQSKQTNDQTAVAAQVNEQKEATTREQQTTNSLKQAESSFLSGHLGSASSSLSVAERLSPSNPLVRDLRSRINVANSLRQRLYFLGGGAGLLGIAGLFATWRYRRKQQKYPVLEMIRGLDSGKHYSIDKDTIRIGAVAQDGGQKNDIVVRDVEHAISRFHCEIQRKNGQLYVTDLKSSNGTRLDGRTLEPGRPVLLRKGSKIDLGGSVELKFGYDRRPKNEQVSSY